jgi:hypothetical protein
VVMDGVMRINLLRRDLDDPAIGAEAAFWSWVNKRGAVMEHVPHLGPCWAWFGPKDDHGYGRFQGTQTKLPRPVLAHRYSFALSYGLFQNDRCVLHACDNPSCVRPEHLFLGTRADNMRDKWLKGRASFGDRHWMRQRAGSQRGSRNFGSKLTETKVLGIKKSLARGETATSLAESHRVSLSTISAISVGAIWNHVPWPDGASFAIDCQSSRVSRRRRANAFAKAVA